MSTYGNVNLTYLRNIKRDMYENTGSSSRRQQYKYKSKSSSRSKSHRNSHCDVHPDDLRREICNTLCDRLCLTPPEDACEKKCVTHQFEVSLGECKVTRDVNVVHKIKANLEHHIKENII